MGAILDRIDSMAGRAADLKPLEARVKARHEAGHREMISRGVDQDGRTVDRLAPSTLKGRKGDGPPRAPRRSGSRVVTECRIGAVASGVSLAVSKGWPGFPAAKFLDEGAPQARLPARGMGLRREDLEADRRELSRYVRGGGV